MEKKRAAFAGTWYPSSAEACKTEIQKFLSEKSGPATGDFAAGIVPHAGWVYSGSIACRTIASLVPSGQTPVHTIVLFGAHMHQQSEPFIMTKGSIETPFGDIEVDGQLVEMLAENISIRKRTPSRFVNENTLELQYPFIKYFFPDAKIVVCGVAPSFFAPIIGSMAVETANALKRQIRVIGSTDMTHYGADFGFTPAGSGKNAVEWVKTKNDAAAIDAMRSIDDKAIVAQGLSHHNMCCPGAAAATAAAAKKMGANRAHLIDYTTSFDKTRSDSFVGYTGLLYGQN
ncbi:MAG: AmmeMemoRadiSam system protein B [Desulfotignum sp.]|nr:AmmeMemoRadiSam system protein B [Desulfotignum sp.]MCF8125478.1 AmmeMemoRadiSam system protein B [Desulfotignum sp.]